MTPAGNAWPGDVETRLSPAEIDNVVAYLAGHKKRDLCGSGENQIRLLFFPYPGIVHPKPGDWTTYWGDYQGTHFSSAGPDHRRQCRPTASRMDRAP